MATAFPFFIDTAFVAPTTGQPMTAPSHAGLHTNLRDAIVALETKVGINNSTDTTSLTYKLNNLAFATLGLGGAAPGVGVGLDNAGSIFHATDSASIGNVARNSFGLTSKVTHTATTSVNVDDQVLGVGHYPTVGAGVTLEGLTGIYLASQPAVATTSKIKDMTGIRMHWNSGSTPGSAPARFDVVRGMEAHVGHLAGDFATDMVTQMVCVEASTNNFGPGPANVPNLIGDAIGFKYSGDSGGARRSWGMQLWGGNNWLAGNLAINARAYDTTGVTPGNNAAPGSGGVGAALTVGGASVFTGPIGVFGGNLNVQALAPSTSTPATPLGMSIGSSPGAMQFTYQTYQTVGAQSVAKFVCSAPNLATVMAELTILVRAVGADTGGVIRRVHAFFTNGSNAATVLASADEYVNIHSALAGLSFALAVGGGTGAINVTVTGVAGFTLNWAVWVRYISVP